MPLSSGRGHSVRSLHLPLEFEGQLYSVYCVHCVNGAGVSRTREMLLKNHSPQFWGAVDFSSVPGRCYETNGSNFGLVKTSRSVFGRLNFELSPISPQF